MHLPTPTSSVVLGDSDHVDLNETEHKGGRIKGGGAKSGGSSLNHSVGLLVVGTGCLMVVGVVGLGRDTAFGSIL
jgi:hypothetical protein